MSFFPLKDFEFCLGFKSMVVCVMYGCLRYQIVTDLFKFTIYSRVNQ